MKSQQISGTDCSLHHNLPPFSIRNSRNDLDQTKNSQFSISQRSFWGYFHTNIWCQMVRCLFLWSFCYSESVLNNLIDSWILSRVSILQLHCLVSKCFHQCKIEVVESGLCCSTVKGSGHTSFQNKCCTSLFMLTVLSKTFKLSLMNILLGFKLILL